MPICREFTEILTKMCSFSQNMGVVTPHFDCLKKLFLVYKGFMPVHQEFTEILTKMCSFSPHFTPHFDNLKKLTLVHEDYVRIYQEFIY